MSVVQDAVTGGGEGHQVNAERRWAHRKPCGYRAAICRPGSGTIISCSIVNMSTTGACLELSDLPGSSERTLHLPAYFTLAIRNDRLEIDCAVVWRKGARLGARFLATPRPITPALAE